MLGHQMQLGLIFVFVSIGQIFTTHTHLEIAPISHAKLVLCEHQFYTFENEKKKEKKFKLTVITFEQCLYMEINFFTA